MRYYCPMTFKRKRSPDSLSMQLISWNLKYQIISTLLKPQWTIGTVLSKIELGEYESLEEYIAEFCLMLDNALMYNAKDSLVYEKAAKYKEKCISDYIATRKNIKIEMETDQKSRKSPSDSHKVEQILLLYHLSTCRNLHG